MMPIGVLLEQHFLPFPRVPWPAVPLAQPLFDSRWTGPCSAGRASAISEWDDRSGSARNPLPYSR